MNFRKRNTARPIQMDTATAVSVQNTPHGRKPAGRRLCSLRNVNRGKSFSLTGSALLDSYDGSSPRFFREMSFRGASPTKTFYDITNHRRS